MLGKKRNIITIVNIIEDWVCNIALIFLALLPVAESFARFFLHKGIPSQSGLVTHLLLVAGLVSGMITTRKKEHLSIGLINYIKSEKIKHTLNILTNAFAAFIALLLAFASAVFIKIAMIPLHMIAFIPDTVFALALPVGFLVMSYRFARAAFPKSPICFLPLALGVLCSAPSVFRFIWGLDIPDFAYNITYDFAYIADFIKIPAIIFIALLAFSGAPLFIVIGALSLLLFVSGGDSADSVITNIYSSLTNSDYVAIALFTLVGFFLSESKAGVRMVDAFKCLFGWFPGGMIFVTVVLCAFFTTFTGASGVTILALGGILYSVLCENAKYPKNFSIGLLTSSGSIGLLFPPSLPIILVGITMQQNILHYFAAGIIPGFILVIAMIVFGIIVSIKTKIPIEKLNIRKALSSIKHSFFEILLPFLLLGGFFSGILSIVEIGAAALVYIFVIEVFVTKEIKLQEVPKVFAKAIPIIGGILSIIAISKALSDYIIFTKAPEAFALWMQNTISSKFVFLLLLNLTLLIVGCLMDIFSATMVVLPLIAPLGVAYGIDPVHLGIIFLINLEAGFLTPPIGLNLFLASYRFEKPFVEICKYVFPFLIIQLAVVLLITFVPQISLFLPEMIFGK